MTKPSWTLRDLGIAMASKSTLRRILQYHDTPEDVTSIKFLYQVL